MGSDLVVDREIGHDALDRVRVTLRLRGLVDLGTQPALERALDDALAVTGVHAIVVDLERLTLLDSTGIATLLHAYRTGRVGGVSLRVTNPTGMVYRVLEITGVLTVLTDV
ncbi:STAS domain-containing protein [Dactylosporangium sp. CA-233914]|uniref:STAS domain-containing protein n=1 Tax=Dactylosporangium sp. CA-233914 TaxID=3239934 RepID=UPI003D92986B